MATTTHRQQQQTNWKEQHMQRAEQVSDVLEVTLAYGARTAEWVIIGCLLAGLFMTLPGVREMVPLLVSNGILGLQMFSLDIAGLGLLPIEKHARTNGNLTVARGARWMIGLLISITIVTSLSFTVGQIVPATQVYTSKIDVALILVRVIVSIFFKLFMGTVRTAGVQAIPVQQYEDKVGELIREFSQQMQRIERATEHNRQQTELRFQQFGKETTEHLSEMLANITETQQRFAQEANRLVATGLPFQLDKRLQPVLNTLERHGEALAILPLLTEQVTHSEQSLQAQVQRLLEEASHLKVSVKQSRAEPPKRTTSEENHTTETRPNSKKIQLVPNVSVTEKPAKGFDKGSFVIACLNVDPTMKGSDIQRRAFEQFGQHISASYISETKTAFHREQSA